MTDRERLLEILNVPIYPHENVDPLEAVADYLLDNGVRIPVLCKDCIHRKHDTINDEYVCNHDRGALIVVEDSDYCSCGERGMQ